MASSALNNDVVTEILLRLPLHTLFRFRKVSKSWADIIHSPSFQKSHILHHSNNVNDEDEDEDDDTRVLVHFHYARDVNIPCSSIMLLDTGNSDSYFPDLRRRKLNRLKTAPGRIVTELTEEFRYGEAAVTGPVNGLLCIYSRDVPNRGITVCNPSLGQTRKLPVHHRCPHPLQTCHVGIGFDDVAHDYKVVQLLSCEEHGGLHASVYSRSTDSWRELAGNGEHLLIEAPIKSRSRSGAAAHWRARLYTAGQVFKDVIVSFDVKNEVFRRFELPDYRKLPPYGAWEIVAKGETFVLLICDCRLRIKLYEARFEGDGSNRVVRWDFVKNVRYGMDGGINSSWNQMDIEGVGWHGFCNDPWDQVDYFDPWGLDINDFNPHLLKHFCRKTIMGFQQVPEWCHCCQGFQYRGSFLLP